MKRFILAEGYHWFYDKGSLTGKCREPYNLIGMLDDERRLKAFHTLPQSQHGRLVLELYSKSRNIGKLRSKRMSGMETLNK